MVSRCVWIRVLPTGYRWWGAVPGAEGSAQQLAAALHAAAAGALPRILLLPGDAVLLASVPFAAGERRLLAQTVPYALEEQLAAPLEQLHIVLGPVRSEPGVGDGGGSGDGGGGHSIAVAVVDRQRLQAWLQPLQEAGCAPQQALPETLALPWQEGQWTLQRGEAFDLLRTGPCSGLALEPAAMAWVLEHLGGTAMPEVVQCHGPLPAWPQPWQERLHAATAEAVQAVETAESAEAGQPSWPPPLNLLQGDFAPALPWRRWYRSWRWPALALILAVLLQFGVALVEQQQLRQQQEALREASEQLFREVVPHGVLVDPELQLRRLLPSSTAAAEPRLMPLLFELVDAMSGREGVWLEQLAFSGDALDIALHAAQADDAESILRQLRTRGLEVDLADPAAVGDATTLRLIVRGRPAR